MSHPNFQNIVDGQFGSPPAEGDHEEPDYTQLYDGLNLNKYNNFDQV